MNTRLRHFIDDDSGVALFTVLGVIMLMTIAVMSAYFLSQQATLESARLKTTQAAFQAANSGVDIALARMQSHGYNAADYAIVGTITATGASYETSVAPQSNGSYLCVSRGVDPKTGQVQTIRVKFFYFSLWNMEIANAGGVSNPSGGALVGNTSVFGPMYCRGTVNLSGSSNMDVGPLMVNQGSITLSGNGSVGSASLPIDVYVTGAYPAVGSNNFYTTSVSNSCPNITLPLVDQNELQIRWVDAKNQSADNKRGDSLPADPVNEECATTGDGSTYRTVNPPNTGTSWYGDAAVTQRRLAPGANASFYKALGTTSAPVPGAPTTTLTIDNSTGSWGSWPGDGHTAANAPGDDFAYDASTGTLHVWGTVYVDGPINISKTIQYVGNGTICANGNISLTGGFIPKTSATATLTAGQMDATHCVGLVTPNNITVEQLGGNTKGPTETPDYCGAFFTGGVYTINGHALVKGSILANTINFAGNNAHLVTEPRLPSFLPAGMPAAGQSLLYKGAWARQ